MDQMLQLKIMFSGIYLPIRVFSGFLEDISHLG